MIAVGGKVGVKKKSNLTRPGEIVDLSIANKNKNPPTSENRKRLDNIIATINNGALAARAYIIIDAVWESAAAG